MKIHRTNLDRDVVDVIIGLFVVEFIVFVVDVVVVDETVTLFVGGNM